MISSTYCPEAESLVAGCGRDTRGARAGTCIYDCYIAITPKDIRNLATELQNAETCLKRHNMYGELNNQECIVVVCGRLTKDMKSNWASKTIKHQRLASEYLSFSDFVTFIANEASRLNDPIFGALQESSTTRAGIHLKPASFATSTDQSAAKDKKSTWSASRRSSCLVCGDSHILFFCKTFVAYCADIGCIDHS